MQSESAAPRGRGALANVLDRDWIFALALAFAVGVTVWFGRAIKDFFGPSAQSVLVPAFTGQTQSDAQSECARLQLRCAVIATQPSDRFPKDVVMSQQPGSGARVREGRQVSLIVSSGVTIFAMPDLRFESLRTAQLEMGRLKLALAKTKYVANDDVPRDHIVAQDPVPLTSVREGSSVTLTLSKGPPGNIKVPNFENKTIDQARYEAGESRIHLGQIVWTPFGQNGPPRGVVVRQNPGPGAQIDPFEEVSLQESDGPGQYGYLVRQVHVGATVPARNDVANVRIEVRDDTGVWNVYNGYANGGQKLDFNVTAIGSAEVNTYLNNELLNSTVVGKEAPTPRPSAASAGRR